MLGMCRSRLSIERGKKLDRRTGFKWRLECNNAQKAGESQTAGRMIISFTPLGGTRKSTSLKPPLDKIERIGGNKCDLMDSL
jgi:hypothetical protein